MDGGGLSPAAPPRGPVWVTRARPAAEETAARLRALGWTPLVEPLLLLRPLPVEPPAMDGVGALAFTSAAGVRAFTALHPGRDLPVFVVGAATARAARAAGWSAVLSADGDVAALGRLLERKAPPGRVLAPGAREPAGLLPRAERLAVYAAEREPGPWPQALEAAARARLPVLLQSPAAARALRDAAPGGVPTGDRWLVLALSLACAEPLAGLAGEVRIAERPTEAALLARLDG